mgnify:CR=1 FL=1
MLAILTLSHVAKMLEIRVVTGAAEAASEDSAAGVADQPTKYLLCQDNLDAQKEQGYVDALKAREMRPRSGRDQAEIRPSSGRDQAGIRPGSGRDQAGIRTG